MRAYSKAASMALEAAGLARMARWRKIRIGCGYPLYDKVRRLLADFGGEEIEAQFGREVWVSALVPASRAADFGARLTDVTAGSAVLNEESWIFRPARI